MALLWYHPTKLSINALRLILKIYCFENPLLLPSVHMDQLRWVVPTTYQASRFSFQGHDRSLSDGFEVHLEPRDSRMKVRLVYEMTTCELVMRYLLLLIH